MTKEMVEEKDVSEAMNSSTEEQKFSKKVVTNESMKKDVKNFLLINLGIVVVIGILMIITKTIHGSKLLGGYPVVMMLAPAYSVMLIKEKINNEIISEKLKKFYEMFKYTIVGTFVIVTGMALMGGDILVSVSDFHDNSFTFKEVFIGVALNMVFYGVFLLSKMYRKNREDVPVNI